MFLKCALPIQLDWNMIFPVLPGKQKMKDDLSQKNTLKFDIFCKCSEKIVFPKKKMHWNMIFLVLSRNMVFLFPKNMILLVIPLRENKRSSF